MDAFGSRWLYGKKKSSMIMDGNYENDEVGGTVVGWRKLRVV